MQKACTAENDLLKNQKISAIAWDSNYYPSNEGKSDQLLVQNMHNIYPTTPERFYRPKKRENSLCHFGIFSHPPWVMRRSDTEVSLWRYSLRRFPNPMGQVPMMLLVLQSLKMMRRLRCTSAWIRSFVSMLGSSPGLSVLKNRTVAQTYSIVDQRGSMALLFLEVGV